MGMKLALPLESAEDRNWLISAGHTGQGLDQGKPNMDAF